jgi:hypothetical protein
VSPGTIADRAIREEPLQVVDVEHEPISGSTATGLELTPVHSGSDAVRRHAEEGRYVLDRVDLAVTEGARHQPVFSPWEKLFGRARRAVRAGSRTTNGDPGIGASECLCTQWLSAADVDGEQSSRELLPWHRL